MKPHIFKRGVFWYCEDSRLVQVGYSVMDAYRLWENCSKNRGNPVGY